ncbi:hypothetical protein BVRB_017320, partial [Beta vulgaris subsp. vulgaris]
EVRLTTSRFVTKLFLDYDIPQITDFKKSKTAKGDSAISQKSSEFSTGTSEFLKEDTIKDICDHLMSEGTGMCVCLGTIEDVDTEFNWYYEACKKCCSAVKKKVTLSSARRKIKSLSQPCQGKYI